jgi:cytochrome c peroxidase
MTRSSLSRLAGFFTRRQWLCLGAAGLSIAITAAASAIAQERPCLPAAAAATDQEPITPIPSPPAADPLKLALGERLFSDRRLSGNGNLACVSCHDIHSNGARPDGSVTQPFNTLTVFNAVLNYRLNWTGNFRSPAAHIVSSLENRRNMNTSVDEVVRKLNADPATVAQFRAAFGGEPNGERFLEAMVTFEKSLLTPGARFDRWLGGDRSALTAEELEGYRLFKSLGCSACHQGVNIGGNLLERQGIFHPLVQAPPEIVRVPSLRNVAATAPYFHDGSAATLEDAVRRMAAAQLDRTLGDQQIALLVGFLQTLTGTYRGVPVGGGAP